MKVRVLFFAAIRDQTGTASIDLELADSTAVGQLRAILAERFPRSAPMLARCMLAVNEAYVGDDHVLPAGAEVAFIPPVSGGCAGQRQPEPSNGSPELAARRRRRIGRSFRQI
jgi:molybdopterin converting factor subunit 1